MGSEMCIRDREYYDGTRSPCRYLERWGRSIASLCAEQKAALWLSRGEALVLVVLLLSFGLWATLWGAVASVAAER